MQKHQRDQRALEREVWKYSTKMNNQMSNELKAFMEQTNQTTQALIEQTERNAHAITEESETNKLLL